jgi:hypothetical protein
MTNPDRTHLDNLAFEEFKPRVRIQYSDFCHPVVFVHSE